MSAILFTEFVDTCFGGVRERAAKALELDSSMVSYLCSGKRNVSPAVALRIEQVSGGKFAKEAFIWPEAATDKAA
jgi:plasmid maintenance system antidote protein VapI